MLERRVRTLKDGRPGTGPVALWMSRDQRTRDNPALLFAQRLALSEKVPLIVFFCIVKDFLGATLRQYDFMLRGLKEVEETLDGFHIPFQLLIGKPGQVVPGFVKDIEACAIVTDFDPLRIKREWKAEVARRVGIPIYEVDAHNIVPCWIASDKKEFSARTIRPRIRLHLGDFLTEPGRLRKHPVRPGWSWAGVDWKGLKKVLEADPLVGPVSWLLPGEKAARRVLGKFIKSRLGGYATERNDPASGVQSDLSPYLHFGQISAQRVALEVLRSEGPVESKEAFLEELIIRKELSDNFCFYVPGYDSYDGFPSWARKTLDEHRADEREYLYSLKDFEGGATHDPLWNAAQAEMAKRGKMHGYMRMYWAKKILEWSESPEEALGTAIYLNDRYELDGRDPNGYAGIAWSIGGLHDRPWPEREIFGKVRYMSYNGMKRKFDIERYINSVEGLVAAPLE